MPPSLRPLGRGRHLHIHTPRTPTRLRQYATTTDSPPLRTALFFPGHGVQRKSMLSPWLSAFPKTCKPFVEEMDHILQCNLSTLIEEGPIYMLDKTENAQPAIMAVSVMILRVLEQEFGFKTSEAIDVTLGHSLGEYAALVAAGYLDFSFALQLVRKRGEIMGECTRLAKEESGDRYGMIALVCEPDQLDGLIKAVQEFLSQGSEGAKDDSSHPPAINRVSIANYNSRNQIVLSGSFNRIKNFGVEKQFGVPQSDYGAAYEYMRKTLKPEHVTWPGKCPTVMNVSGKPAESKEDLMNCLSRQAIETVLWWDSIKYLDRQAGTRRWLGVGPGKVGRNLVSKEVGRSSAKGGGVWSISDPGEVEATLRGLEETAKEANS
ncbi:Malonyl CoA-acyl carrier protein transacylase [Cyphellophora attinorum]|uniref:[acyl-carrier-protein] S-malonyltransferase n=1 Tax=Cyphellophora attinorum TaxID=1664694 RepID=A0A0N0NNR1_9EURO|nr:Malonyl CoA-acyl carrier protein transacylase [Phialophora attinorum]KPI41881.1 Malonyl CoA-acyl carrier protein transacylase [Phialophora attinorum]